MSNLLKRTLSGIVFAVIVLIPVFLGKQFYELYSIPLFPMLLALMGAGLSWEWDSMLMKQVSEKAVWLTVLSSVCAFVAPTNPLLALWMVVLGTLFLLLKYSGAVALAFGALYICLPIVALNYIYYINDSISVELVVWLIFIVWATDTGAYFVGSTVKGPKIAPKISPNKTWSGLCGGMGAAVLVTFVLSRFMEFNSVGFLMGLAAVLAVVAQVGDFFESFIKRSLKIKDSSNMIPGHGGLFDRVDGLLFASVALAFLLFVDKQGWISWLQ